MSYIPFTAEQKQIANGTDLASFLCAQGETVKRVGTDEYVWTRHGSSRINGNKWVHNASGEGGYPIKFVQHFFNCSYKDAMLRLLDFNRICIESTNTHDKMPENTPILRNAHPFILPPRDKNMKRTFAYLTKTRHIPSDVVSFFAHEHKIYQADRSHYHNIVFVGHDEKNEPVYATKRSASEQVSFHGDAAGSNKRQYCFNYFPEQAKEPKHSSNTLLVFEAPIDMLSYIATVKDDNSNRNNNLTWQNDSYMALGGTSSSPLFHYLSYGKEKTGHDMPQKIILALDRDEAGIRGMADILLKLTKEYPEIDVFLKLSHYKDWNADLTNSSIVNFDQSLAKSDTLIISNDHSNTLKVLSNVESMIYKLTEDKHISNLTGRSLPSFFVLDEDNIATLRHFLNERFRSNPVSEIHFYANGHESNAWNDEVSSLIEKSRNIGMTATLSLHSMESLSFNLLNTIHANEHELQNLISPQQAINEQSCTYRLGI